MRATICLPKMEDAVQDETAPPDFSSYEGSDPFFITDAHIMCCAFVVLSALLVPIAAKVLTAAARRLSYRRWDFSFESEAGIAHPRVVEQIVLNTIPALDRLIHHRSHTLALLRLAHALSMHAACHAITAFFHGASSATFLLHSTF